MHFKKGAASFYIVAFSTLILIIIATSFAAIIVSEITRTSNDDLSQSAYDSALAGIEDAKIAFTNYQKCIKEGKTKDSKDLCGTIISKMEKPECDMVGVSLERLTETQIQEGDLDVVIKEIQTENNMQQAYTCVKIKNVLSGYTGNLSSTQPNKVVRVKFDEPAHAKDIESVKISWSADNNKKAFQYTNWSGENGNGQVKFSPLGGGNKVPSNPPTVYLGLIQTANTFDLESFDTRHRDSTNRGMIYLVPTGSKETAQSEDETNYFGTKNNTIEIKGFLKSNDKTAKNLPYAVYCEEGGDYACSATIKIPDPYGGNGIRNDDTFTFIAGLPYGQPSTKFVLEFFCAEGKTCSVTEEASEGGEEGESTETIPSNQANLKNVQIEIDSTGRANDLFRRVKALLEPAVNGGGGSLLSIMGPLELFPSDKTSADNSSALEKAWAVTAEHNF